MVPSNDDPAYPAEPGTETKIRFAKTRETTHGANDVRIDPPMWKVGDVLEGYILEKLLGSGVTSSVYRVRDVITGRNFALKLLRTRCEITRTASRVGFRRMEMFSHPSLVAVDHILHIGDYIGFTMDEVVGRRLVEVINETRHLDRAAVFQLATRLLHDIGGALQTLHDAGVVHRDVKPENVMIDEHGQAILIDYGLVGSYDPESDPDARRNYLAGTYWYMAPESISEQMYPPACDVYALGCIVLELIASRSRLPAVETGVSLGQSIGDVRSFLPRDTPADLADLLCDMLDPAPRNRPVAARLVQFNSRVVTGVESPTNFRRGQMRSRHKEMATAEKWVHSVVLGRPTRLHVYGESGVGKTWFLAELQRRIRANPWFQVFDSACRERADVSLQSFDAMADAIARRYSRGDRDSIQMSPRSALALRQAFPSLRKVIALPELLPEELEDYLDRPADRVNDTIIEAENEELVAKRLELVRADSLASGVELVDQMCQYGPLFLVFDDMQWADQDSLNVLDKLLSDAQGQVGIISIGRTREDRFCKPADVYIDLNPLTDRDAIDLLRSLLDTTSLRWREQALLRLASLGEGNSYRLTQLAACVRQDDCVKWHDRLLAGSVEIEQIWQSRIDQLSDDAKVAVQTLAIAGGPVRLRDLTFASGLVGRSYQAVKELVNVRLVLDETPKRDAIQIVHQRVANCIISRLDPQRCQEIHIAWATHLNTCDQDQWRAARIAGHFLSAGLTTSAIPHIVQAAQDAEARFAFIEAARWHKLAAVHLTGSESVAHLAQAINHFADAACPDDAADACQELLCHPSRQRTPSAEIQLHCQLASQQFRCGRNLAACQSVETAITLATSTTTACGSNSFRYQAEVQSKPLALIRPLLTFDVVKAIKLFRTLPPLVDGNTTTVALLRQQTDAALVACRNPGPGRRRSTAKLEQLVETTNLANNQLDLAIAKSGLALRHLLACDWASTAIPAAQAAAGFKSGGLAFQFDAALVRLPMLWSFLWLGRLSDLKSIVSQLRHEGNEQNDEYLNLIAQSGLSCATDLIDDDPVRAKLLSRKYRLQARSLNSPWVNLFQGFAPLLRRLYKGQSLRGLRYHKTLVNGPRQAILKQVQLPRVLCLQFEAILHLRVAHEHPVNRESSIAMVHRVCERLNQERIPYAKAIAKFYAAQAHEMSGQKAHCLELYAQAAEAADSLDLVPFRLAAIDRRGLVKGETRASETRRFFASEGVKVPEKFCRLYCGLCP